MRAHSSHRPAAATNVHVSTDIHASLLGIIIVLHAVIVQHVRVEVAAVAAAVTHVHV